MEEVEADLEEQELWSLLTSEKSEDDLFDANRGGEKAFRI